LALLSSRIVEGEKIAVQAPSREFGETVRFDSQLTQEYVDLSNQITKFFSDALQQSPIILANNVTDYLFGIEAIQSNAKWDLLDLPVLVPPFPGVFIETSNPRQSDNPDMRGWGALFLRQDEAEAIENSEIPAETVKWTIEMALVYDNKGLLRTYPAVWCFYLDDNGRLLRNDTGEILYETATLVEPSLAGTVDGNKRWETVKESVMTLVLPFFYTFAFCHCRNVELRQQEVSRQVRRQAERKGLPILDYRVLEIEPMKRVLRTEGGIEEVGPRKALKICRGHFKTYTADAPLFGQHVGTWWWEGQLRTSLRTGQGKEDYRVTPPNAKNPQ